MAPRTYEAYAQTGVTPTCELRRESSRWSSLWGHGTCEACAKTSVAPTIKLRHRGRRRSFTKR
eukprot:5704171-Pyramimonas_sp.AAC.1